MNIIELAKEAGLAKLIFGEENGYTTIETKCDLTKLDAFAALVRADLMKQVMNTCEAEYKLYDKMVEEDDSGHEECCALIHLMRKLEKLK